MSSVSLLRRLPMKSMIFSVLLSFSALIGLALQADAKTVAKIGNTDLTEEQMREEMGMQLYQIENNLYMTQKNWVDKKAQEILFDQAAKEAGLSRKKWEEREIDAKVP